jgi:hypothetical protein
MSKRREQLRDRAEAAAWVVRFAWLRARENLGAEAAIQRDAKRDDWTVTKGNGRRCVGRGATIGEAIDAAMRNATA